MENTNVVKEPLTPVQPSEGETPQANIEEGLPPAPGAKTDSELLLKSLQEEREKRRLDAEKNRLLEEELETLKSSIPSDTEVFSDEGKALQKEISTLKEQINSIEEEKNFEKLFNQFPDLREHSDKFKEFRQGEHPRAKLESVAKLFLLENGLLEPQRKGLEKPTGGTRVPEPQGMTAEDIGNLRKNDYRKYTQMLKTGQIKI